MAGRMALRLRGMSKLGNQADTDPNSDPTNLHDLGPFPSSLGLRFPFVIPWKVQSIQ